MCMQLSQGKEGNRQANEQVNLRVFLAKKSVRKKDGCVTIFMSE